MCPHIRYYRQEAAQGRLLAGYNGICFCTQTRVRSKVLPRSGTSGRTLHTLLRGGGIMMLTSNLLVHRSKVLPRSGVRRASRTLSRRCGMTMILPMPQHIRESGLKLLKEAIWSTKNNGVADRSIHSTHCRVCEKSDRMWMQVMCVSSSRKNSFMVL